MKTVLSLLVVLLFTAGFASAIDLTSPAFKANEKIPAKYSCDGQNINPAFNFSNIPAGTKQLVLTMHDPDVPKTLLPSGNFDHWFVWDIPANSKGIPEGTGAMMGMNGTGKPGYIGPCPPDRQHRYFFRLYAVDIPLQGKMFKDRAAVEDAIKGHTLAMTELIGLFDKAKKSGQ